MPYSFTIKFNDEISDVLKKVELIITENGGIFEGSTDRGFFHGKTVAGLIKGEYCSVLSNEIKITITDKPFIVPYSMIEVEIKKYFC